MPRPKNPNRSPRRGQPAGGPLAAPTPEQVRLHQIKARVAPLLQSSQHALAASLLEEVLPLDRRDPMIHKMLGGAYAGLQNDQKAILHLRRAADLGLDDADTLVTLASVMKNSGDVRSSLKIIEKILAREPGEGRAARLKAFLLRSMGESEKALAWIDTVRERIGPHPDTTVLRAELLTRFKRFEEAEAELRSILDDQRVDDRHRRDALYDLGALLDKTERYDEAFDAVLRANRMLPEEQPLTIDQFRGRWTPEAIGVIPVSDERTERPVFVVGMPRSGTTLTEQIIAAHPSAGTVGESSAITTAAYRLLPDDLTPEKLGEIARVYLAETESGAGKGKKSRSRVVDKMPENYYFLHIITRAMPGARVIHCTRDPRDTGISCLFQNFGSRLGWTRRLETIGKQYRLYRGVMDLWAETLGVEILESNYERLTADPRPGVEAMLAHIGLPFDEACLSHHQNKSLVQTASVDQVRNPIYTSSTQRWKRYEQHIGPMVEELDGLV